MKKRVELLIILLALTLLGTGAGALSVPRYQVETGTISGESNQLTSAGPQADFVSTAGTYRLLGLATPVQQGSGGCCTFLPCILGSHWPGARHLRSAWRLILV